MNARTESGAAMLARLARRFAPHGPPVIVFNKSHSGSRVLARLLSDAGLFMGSERNESEDAADIMRLVRPLVERHYPNYAAFMRSGDPDIENLIVAVLERHLAGRRGEPRWGWKLCETLYILPILDRLFPGAALLHLVRDGRDVAFSDHVAPSETFWRKIYFDTAAVDCWHGRRLDQRSYAASPHVFNARHWVNSVTVARHYGAMIGERYHEIRYEELVARPEKVALDILEIVGMAADDGVLRRFAAAIGPASVGKHRSQPAWRLAEALAVLEPTLASFGYGLDEPAPRLPPSGRGG
jgi:hypothetical protein